MQLSHQQDMNPHEVVNRSPRGGSRVSGKGVHIYKDVGVCFAEFISFF